MKRCNWPKLEGNVLYEQYHDNEWGVPSYDDQYMFEMLVLESFQSGLSWLTVLRKREDFRKAFNDFNVKEVASFSETKVNELMNNERIIRNRAKILAAINNAMAFMKLQDEYGSFSDYIWSFTKNEILYGNGSVPKNDLSDRVAKDLKKHGFKFMGSVTTYSFLEAIGVMNNHADYCFKHIPQENRPA